MVNFYSVKLHCSCKSLKQFSLLSSVASLRLWAKLASSPSHQLRCCPAARAAWNGWNVIIMLFSLLKIVTTIWVTVECMLIVFFSALVLQTYELISLSLLNIFICLVVYTWLTAQHCFHAICLFSSNTPCFSPQSSA